MPDAGIGTLISGGASIVGGLLSGSGAKEAASTQAQSGQSAINAQEKMFQQNRADLAPYRAEGQAALYTLGDYLGLNVPGAGGAGGQQLAILDANGVPAPNPDLYKSDPQYKSIWDQMMAADPSGTKSYGPGSDINQIRSQIAAQYTPPAGTPSATTGSLLKPFSFDISQDPGYQFRLGQGEQAITNRASATGGVSGSGDLSGATLKELLRYGQDYASGEYGAAFARDQATKAQQFGELAGVAGMGQGATNVGVQAGQQTAAGIGNTITGIGNAQAAGQVGSANALGGAFSNVGSGVNQAMLLKSIMGNPGVNQVNQGVNLGQFASQSNPEFQAS